MKDKKKPIIIFMTTIVVMTFFFEWVYNILTGNANSNLIGGVLLDLPFIIFMAFVSLAIIHTTNKYFKYRNNIYIRVVFELLATALFTVIYSILIKSVFRSLPVIPTPPDYLEATIVLIVGNIVIVLMLELFFYNQRQLEYSKHIAIIEKERAEYLYATLKTQINPHFLFNSLNVLSSLIFEDTHKANIYTKKLSNIYRYVLSTNALERIEVKEEITFLESYIYLLSIRFEKVLTIIIDGNKNTQKHIIPVSLQLLLENAIKHNIASDEQPLTVTINIDMDYVEVVNNLQLRMNVEEGGYGLSNLQKQYSLHDKVIEMRKTETQFIVRIPYL